MAKSKYYDTVKSLESVNLEAKLPPFDIDKLNPQGIKAKFAALLLSRPRLLLKLARRCWPTPTFSGLTIISRADDVQEALANTKVFEVPFGHEMKIVSGGGEFILGINNGQVYRAQKSLVLRAFPPDKMSALITDIAAKQAKICMRTASHGFNPIRDLFVKSALMVCRDYFGLKINNEQRFYESSLAVSSLLFADPYGSKVTRELAMSGAKHLLNVMELSIEQEQADPSGSPLGTLIQAHQEDPDAVPMHDVKSIMMGMILGFLPTTILGLGNALGVILDKSEAKRAVIAAVGADDDARLTLCIKEAMRFDPIQIGPFRYCAQDYVLAEGKRREKKIPKGALVMPSTLSAMFDPRRVQSPEEYRPERSEQDSMIFGYMSHTCIGAPMALAFSTQMIKALFSLKNLARANGKAGRMRKLGIFPDEIALQWEHRERYGDQPQSMCVVTLAIMESDSSSTHNQDILQTGLENLGNVAPRNGPDSMAEKLDADGTIHFASGCISAAVPLGRKTELAHLIFEISGDGAPDEVIKSFAETLEPNFCEQIKTACDPKKQRPISELLIRNQLSEVGPLNRNLGLKFNGTPGHTVHRIKKEAELFELLSEKIETSTFTPTTNALKSLNDIRESLGKNPDVEWAYHPVRNRLSEPPQGLIKFLRQYIRWPWAAMPTSIALGFVFLNFMILGGWQDSAWYNLWHLGAAISMTVVGGVILVGAIAGTVVALLRRKEKTDSAELIIPSQSDYDAITANENQLQQNHMFAVSRIKAGFLRQVLLRAVLWSIRVSIGFRNKPGIVSVINTIHFAKWVKIPKTQQLLFLSNYGGSWESYLEDFITHGSDGLTGIWSNTEGFPRTRYLLQRGATLSEPFKNWARQQQKPTPFWYVAYPNLTTREIRKNAQIRDGFATINDTRKARQWFRLFGSSYRPNKGLDKSNIQSLVFGGMGKKFPNTKMLFVSLSADNNKRANKAVLEFLLKTVQFGERIGQENVWQVAFTNRGLQRLGLTSQAKFSNVFRQGMDSTARSRILGDLGEDSSEKWRWGSDDRQVDLLLISYFDKQTKMVKDNLKELRGILDEANASIVYEQDTKMGEIKENGHAMEHFQFSDGVSQPIIKGTVKSYRTDQRDHVIAPGEILCGYPDERNNIAPSPVIDCEFDAKNILPEEPFQPRSGRQKDFGFNGTYLVVRQLEQHVEKFESFCNKSAKHIQDKSGLDYVNEDWVAAKMIGRWKDGRSLVQHPNENQEGKVDNNFRYRDEDPQGLHCPLGAHIRRANPRDSLGDDKETQIKLSNRHRILRVGRAYENKQKKSDTTEKGLMFMCMNSDIERQFEFVQQTWLNNSNFHGLVNQEDSISTGVCPANRQFSIPTDQGMVTLKGLSSFVSVRGGSYFFMPGKHALIYLSKL